MVPHLGRIFLSSLYSGFLLYLVVQSQYRACNGVCSIEPDSSGHVDIPIIWSEVPPFAFANCLTLKSIDIPLGVKKIGTAAFRDARNLKNVNLSEGLESIGPDAFRKVITLESIAIPSNVKYIGPYVFRDCESLKELTIPGGIIRIWDGFCQSCKSLATLTIEEGVQEIKPSAFSRCRSLRTVNLPTSLTHILDDAFTESSSLESIYLPDGISKIDKRVFELCTSLKTVNFPPKVTKISERAFAQTLLETIVLPENTKGVQVRSFAGLGISPSGHRYVPTLKNVTLKSPDEFFIYESAFAINIALQTVRFEAIEIVRVYQGAFENCPNVRLYFKRDLKALIGLDGYTCEGVDKHCNCARGYGNVLYGIKGEEDYFSCAPCQAGYTSEDGQGECVKCPEGTYATGNGTAICTPCDKGKSSNVKGATSEDVCEPCFFGEYAPSQGSSSCLPCPPGSYCDEIETTLYHQCSPGKFTSASSQMECELCPQGKYESRSGSAACQECPAGKFVDYAGATSFKACANCSAGTYSDQPGFEVCNDCATGTFQPDEGMSSCIECTTLGKTMTNSEDHTKCIVNQALLAKDTPEQSLAELMFSNGVAVYVSFIISAVMTAIFAVMQYLREKEGSAKLGQVNRLHLIPKCSLPSLSFASEMFLIVAIFSQSPAIGSIMLVFRLLHVFGVIFIMGCLFAGERTMPFFKMVVPDGDTWKTLLNFDFAKKNIPAVAVVSILAMADVSMVQMLPWAPSTFYRESNGFPCKSLMRFSLGLDTLQASVSVVCQIIFLVMFNNVNSTSTKPEAKALFALNITTGLLTVIMAVVMLFLKDRLLKVEKANEGSNEDGQDDNTIRRGSAMVELSGVYGDREERAQEAFTNPLHGAEGGGGGGTGTHSAEDREGSGVATELREQVAGLVQKLEHANAKVQEMEKEVAVKSEELGTLRRRLTANDEKKDEKDGVVSESGSKVAFTQL